MAKESSLAHMAIEPPCWMLSESWADGEILVKPGALDGTTWLGLPQVECVDEAHPKQNSRECGQLHLLNSQTYGQIPCECIDNVENAGDKKLAGAPRGPA